MSKPKEHAVRPYILVVEDEESISMLIQYNLEQSGFDVRVEADGQDALYAVDERRPDLVLLDWMLPTVSGIEIATRIRGKDETASIPIIMLTARGEEGDRLQGLDIGADDYMIKPFSPKELIARIRAVLRRTRPAATNNEISFGDLVADLNRHKVAFKGNPIQLGPTEFRLLIHFMEHPKKVFSRSKLLDAVWGNEVYVELRTVDVHIRRLRKALGMVNPKLEDFIHTVRSAGYMLDTPEL